jgi:beta-1,4-mannosyl-glycoprotein beta-1,4-N-acetylglucosaminyltransferase
MRERFQREQIFRGLQECRDQDIILLSDVDEIVRGSNVDEIVQQLALKKTEAVVCGQKMYYGYLNRFQGEWPGTVCTTYKDAKRISIGLLRKLRNRRPKHMHRARISQISYMPFAGWHFTSVGGVERHITKVESFSHTKFDNPEYKTRENILRLFRVHPKVEIDETFPRFVQDNQEHFKKIGFIDTAD